MVPVVFLCCKLWLTNDIIYSLLIFLSSEPPLKSLNMVMEGSVVPTAVGTIVGVAAVFVGRAGCGLCREGA